MGTKKMNVRLYAVLAVMVCLCIASTESKSRTHRHSIVERLHMARNRVMDHLARCLGLRRRSGRDTRRWRHMKPQKVKRNPRRNYVRIDEPVYLDLAPVLQSAQYIENNAQHSNKRRRKSLNFRRPPYNTNHQFLPSYPQGSQMTQYNHNTTIRWPNSRKCVLYCQASLC